MEELYLIAGYFAGRVPLLKALHTAYIFVYIQCEYLHFWYLKCLVIVVLLGTL